MMSRRVHDHAGAAGTLDRENNAVNVPDGWAAREGAQLIGGLHLGKALGQGFQGVIFELVDTNGRRAPIVLKAAKSAALISDMEREWNAGVRVGALALPNGELPGLMKVGPALRNSQGKLVGQVLERINGKSCSKVISQKSFNDVWYIRSMLKQTFVALDAAQRAYGFHHYDLRLDNIMEHTPSPDDCAQDELSRFVMGECHADPASRKERSRERQFKMIDFGLTKFDDNYSMARGWVESASAGRPATGDVMEEESMLRETIVKSQKDPNKLVGMEWLHRSAWKGKGDCYHILLDLSRAVYGRTWPREDAIPVYLMMALINHTCSVVPQAFFTPRPEAGPSGDTPADRVAEAVMSRKSDNAFPRRFTIQEEARTQLGRAWQGYLWWSLVRRAARDMKAWHWPSNSGLRAAEALQSAFFNESLDDRRSLLDLSGSAAS